MRNEHEDRVQARQRRRFRDRIRERKGSSLTETLAALAVFAFSTATVGDFLVDQIRAVGSNHSHTDAYELGIQELEDLRSLEYEDISSRSAQIQKGAILYALATSVEENSPAPEMKSITVEVAWDEPGGTQYVVLETIDSADTH